MPSPDVTETELSVLKRLWESPDSTIRQLADHLYPGGTTSHYATVQKLLERLETKKCVKRHAPPGEPHRFAAIVAREELMDGRLRELADRFCEGSLTPLLTHLIKSHKLSSSDMEELRALVQEKRPSKPRGKSEGR